MTEDFTLTRQKLLEKLDVSENKGLSEERAVDNAVRFGINQLSRPDPESLLKKIWLSLTEPMILMLIVAALIAFGVNYIRGLSGEETEYIETANKAGAIIEAITKAGEVM